jgi:hypothetical protein
MLCAKTPNHSLLRETVLYNSLTNTLLGSADFSTNDVHSADRARNRPNVIGKLAWIAMRERRNNWIPHVPELIRCSVTPLTPGGDSGHRRGLP